jgi:hypothetical protein
MSGDLRAALRVEVPENWAIDAILAALAAADEPLVTEVGCGKCDNGFTGLWELDGEVEEGRCYDCRGTGTVRIVAVTEDVLRERLSDGGRLFTPTEVDAIVRAVFGEATDE